MVSELASGSIGPGSSPGRGYCVLSGAIIGDGDRKRAISSTGAVPMIWDNLSIFRANCAIACGTRAYLLRGFLQMSRG